ncbi:MAG: type 4a pilus biogenesis protein PilO [Candidatus Muiribacteriota bacterium]
MNDKVLIFIVFVMIFTGMFGWWYFMEYTPLQQEQEELNAEEVKLRKDLEEGGRIEQEIAEQQEILQKTQEEYEMTKTAVITTDDMSIPDLIRVVRNYSKQAEIEFNEIQVGKIFSYEYYDELPVDFNFTGTYHNMGRMMARLENLKLINARKGRFSLSPYKDTGSSGRTPGRSGVSARDAIDESDDGVKISMDLSASSFMFKSAGGRW